MAQGCRRCVGITKDGVRCKNLIACDAGCRKYCHVHSRTYPTRNTHCTTPRRRKVTGAVKRSQVKPSRK